jgi:hypothetical protein
MIKILEAADILAEVQGLMDCISLAAASLDAHPAHAIRATAKVANDHIYAAITVLDEYRNETGAGPEPLERDIA